MAVPANMSESSERTIHDVKETSKRVTEFSSVAILVASATVVTNFIYGNILSALLVVALIVVLGVMIYINKKVSPKLAQVGILVLLNIFLLVIAFAEGLDTASVAYFLPLLYAIPFFLDNTEAYRLRVVVYAGFTFVCFGICIVFCDRTSNWQSISPAIAYKMYITNWICAFILCAVFAYLSVYLERRYATALLAQILKTEDAMHARTRFLSSMGHELRTPLNGIIGATNLLRSGRSLTEQKEYLDILKYCSDHMLGLVNDVLDFNKIEAGQLDLHPIEVNLARILQQSILPFYNRFEEKSLLFQVDVDEQLDELVLVDDLRLVQVINNLLSNALKFTEAGTVRLEAKLLHKKDNLLTISFAVHDTGIGIKSADQQKIFGSFWQVYSETTRKYGGTGLGLTICQRLLTMMNSSLQIESEMGRGSSFSFQLEVPVILSKKEKILQPDQHSNLDGIRILLAEDNIINMMIAKKILEDNKAILTTAINGQEALLHLEQGGQFDIILLDLEMPVMDGYTAITKIRSRYPHLPVLAFTAALLDQEMLSRLFALGFRDYILKPFQPMDLFGKVRRYARPVVDELV